MDAGTRRLLYGAFAALAIVGLLMVLLAILLAPAGVAYWIYGALGIVLVALAGEVALLFVGRPKRPEEETYDLVLDGDAR